MCEAINFRSKKKSHLRVKLEKEVTVLKVINEFMPFRGRTQILRGRVMGKSHEGYVT